MRKLMVTFLLLIGALVAFSACGPVTPIPSATPMATVTNTATERPTLTATPTITPTLPPTQTPVFPLPTMQVYSWETPTAIATPQEKSADYHLKKMDEAGLAQMIAWMNDYSVKNYPNYGDWWTESQFEGSQQAVAVAIQEYLYRFPNSRDSDQYRWQLAFISAIDWNSKKNSVDDLMISSIQNELDSGTITPETLETFLDRYWFDLGFLRRIDNLFGDGKTAWFYEVVPQYWQDYERNVKPNDTEANWGGEGLFFVVRENLAGHFDVFLLKSAWNDNESNIFDISDRNQNGTPEISLYIGSHSGTMCGGNLLVYEWNGQEFVELTRSKIEFIDCGVEFSYFEYNGRPAIRAKRNFSESEAGFVWNGKYYQFDRYLDDDLFNVWQSSYGDHKSEVAVLTKMLGSEDSTRMEAGLTNYLRFRLGVLYALENQRDEAMKIFKQLASSPITLPTDVFPEMATRFLEYYEQPNIFRACVETDKMYRNVLAANKDSTGSLRDDFFKELFGISVDYPPNPTCDGDDAFPLLISSISSGTKDLPGELKQHGISLAYVRQLDVNRDGQDEWIIATRPYNTSYIVWLQGDTYQVKPASLFDDNSDLTALKISIEKWPVFTNPVMIFSLAGKYKIVEVDKMYGTNILLESYVPGNLEITDVDTSPQVQFTYFLPKQDRWYPYLPTARYRWNVHTQEFEEVSMENLLFIENNPSAAINLFTEILPRLAAWERYSDTSKWELPGFYYVSALAYEFSGDDKRAVELYWQLWRKFPDSHYVRMARFKLEPNQ
jgi:hypothetical protein